MGGVAGFTYSPVDPCVLPFPPLSRCAGHSSPREPRLSANTTSRQQLPSSDGGDGRRRTESDVLGTRNVRLGGGGRYNLQRRVSISSPCLASPLRVFHVPALLSAVSPCVKKRQVQLASDVSFYFRAAAASLLPASKPRKKQRRSTPETGTGTLSWLISPRGSWRS